MKELYVKVQHGDDRSSYVFPLSDWRNNLEAELDGVYEGDKIVLTVIEMEKEEYDKLPEFTGW